MLLCTISFSKLLPPSFEIQENVIVRIYIEREIGTEERKEEKEEREFKKRKVTAFSSGNRALKCSQFSGVKRLKL